MLFLLLLVVVVALALRCFDVEARFEAATRYKVAIVLILTFVPKIFG